MATITEDYVSFEIAKLINIKGFKGEFHKHYWGYEAGKEFLTESSFNSEYDYPAPTLQMAMKWLREDKKILISIFCHIDKGYWFCIQHFVDSPYKFATSESIHRKEEILGKIQYYNTYEQSCEAAIKYCLEHLI